MRSLTVVFALALLAAVPGSAKSVDPGALVLRQSDVPSDFRLDRTTSGVRPNAREARSDPRLPKLFKSWKRITGYWAEFGHGNASIASRADLFRGPRGARGLLAWFSRQLVTRSPVILGRSSVSIGVGGRVYSGPGVTIVAWRSGRVFAGVVGEGLPKAKTVALARAQQRRIAAALR